MNCDVAVWRNNLYFVAVCRNYKGDIMEARAGKKGGQNPLRGEVLAVWQRLSVAKENSYLDLIIEI